MVAHNHVLTTPDGDLSKDLAPVQYILALSAMGVVGDLLMSQATQKILDQPRQALMATTIISTLECVVACMVLILAGHGQGLGQLLQYPWLMTIGLQSVIYHTIEIALYRCTWAPVLKPLVNMVALLLLSPAAVILNLENINPVPFIVFMLGVIGTCLITMKFDKVATMCFPVEHKLTEEEERMAEKKGLLAGVGPPPSPTAEEGGPAAGSVGSMTEDSTGLPIARPITEPSSVYHQMRKLWSTMQFSWDFMVVLGLALCVAFWQVLQRATHECCGIHGLAFLVIDQVIGGVMMLVMHVIIDLSPSSTRDLVLSGDERDQKESLGQCLKSVFWTNANAEGLACITVGKLLANVRVVWSFFLVVTYNLSAVFYSITTMRMVLAFFASSALLFGGTCFAVNWCDWTQPSTTEFYRKCFGVVLITISFIVLQEDMYGKIF